MKSRQWINVLSPCWEDTYLVKCCVMFEVTMGDLIPSLNLKQISSGAVCVSLYYQQVVSPEA